MKILRVFLAFALMTVALNAQNRTTVAISKGTPDSAVTALFFYDASNNLEYICKAPVQQPTFVWAVTPGHGQGTLTSIVVLTNVGTVTTSTAHGLQVGNLVVVAGSTTSALNGAYKIKTVPTSTTFTITTVGVSNATYSTSLLTLSTGAPRTVATGWSIEKLSYDASSNLTADQFATRLVSGSVASTAYSFICGDRATTTTATEIAYQ